MPGACVFHCLDFKLANEWLKTSSEYFGYVRRPFQSIPLRQLWHCKQSDWEAAFREWGVIQFWVGVLAAIGSAIVMALGEANFIGAGIELVTRVIIAYLLAHLCWFGIVRKSGCFCCVVACCEGPPILLLWGALAVVWGILAFLNSLTIFFACVFCFINAILTGIYGVTLLYMGICCLHIWRNHGSEIIPPAVEVKGPEGAVVGAVQTA
mmetsp:Transcript_18162/g.45299  ORF Transcript_18162/g.45299 Transcript_18162/m.45299 type:complete len:209 (+) Transcript_18162:64-690(+)